MNLELDQDGHLVDYTIWNEEVAQVLADSLELSLTPWHFEILQAVMSVLSAVWSFTSNTTTD